MARFIVSLTSPPGRRFPAQTHELMQLFGITNGRWPAAGCKLRFIQDIAVHVLPIDHVALRNPNGTKARKHRVIAACPDCGVAVSAGRLQQHKCAPKRKRRSRHNAILPRDISKE